MTANPRKRDQMKKLFFRCNSGHYFSRASCPWDGWSLEGLSAALDRAEEMPDPTLAGLAAAGVDAELLKRSVIIEFQSESSSFDGLAPRYWLIEHTSYDEDTVPRRLIL